MTSLSSGKVDAAPETTRRPRRRPGENRERLIAAGIEQFARLGYHGASTSAIGASAEVSQPHVYANFATKQDLFDVCVRRACAQLVEWQGNGAQAPLNTTATSPDPSATSPDATASTQPARLAVYQLLFQAVAAVNEFAELREVLLDTRRRVGSIKFSDALEEAATSLLRDTENADNQPSAVAEKRGYGGAIL